MIVVASVSCIYGLGSPMDYRSLMLHVEVGGERPRRDILRGLVDIQYRRNDYLFERGTLRVRGDTFFVGGCGRSCICKAGVAGSSPAGSTGGATDKKAAGRRTGPPLGSP